MQEQAMCAAQAQRVYEKDKADPVSANLVRSKITTIQR